MTIFEPKKHSAGMARLFSVAARAAIYGETGSTFYLTAREGYISIADGGSVYSWGYTTGAQMQLPGPTLIVTASEEATVTVILPNAPPAAGHGRIPGWGGASPGPSPSSRRRRPPDARPPPTTTKPPASTASTCSC